MLEKDHYIPDIRAINLEPVVAEKRDFVKELEADKSDS